MKRIFLAAALALALCAPLSVAAAGAGMTVAGPPRVAVGQEFTAAVKLNGAVDVDTVRIRGQFPPDLLEWRGIRQAGPFQNVSPGNGADAAAGTFSFGAFTFGPYANGNAHAAIITFRARKSGTAAIRLISGSDAYSAGEGSVTSLGSASVVISGAALPVPAPLQKFQVTSPVSTTTLSLVSATHPDPNTWYADPDVRISWQTTKPVASIFGSFDQSPETSAYGPLSGNSATFTATGDGQWYAHLAIAFHDKTYGRIDFPVRIDRTPPRPITPTVEQTNVPPSVPNKVYFATTDDASGIDRYDVMIDGAFVTSTKDMWVPLANFSVGTHTVEVTAYDLAKNHTSGKTTFTIAVTGKIASRAPSLWERIPAPYRQFVIPVLLILAGLFSILFLIRRKRNKKSQKTT